MDSLFRWTNDVVVSRGGYVDSLCRFDDVIVRQAEMWIDFR